ncbi:MAG: 1-acyl-sn-glycerol-3-phosphate acyltransferase [Hyphomicrobiaceae bacterium]|nr:1-acyl-sn-glycerol-3-phosphate acyltransferase [Hyphomicrobiaceae bacterium]
MPGLSDWANAARATIILAVFAALTLPLMPVQWALLRISSRAARRFPHWYHKRVCRLLGIRLHIKGEIPPDTPVLIVSNHVSWLDIPVLSAAAPVSFIAKREVGQWPFVSSLAKLQRTIFIDRARRSDVPKVAAEMQSRLQQGDTLVLFAEGTSSDGNRVLPFKSSLLAIAAAGNAENSIGRPVQLQTLAVVYTHVHGVPLGRANRHLIGWYGDMEMGGHAWSLLKAGPIDVTIRISPPLPLSEFADRKALARHTEDVVRANVVDVLRGRDGAPAQTPH